MILLGLVMLDENYQLFDPVFIFFNRRHSISLFRILIRKFIKLIWSFLFSWFSYWASHHVLDPHLTGISEHFKIEVFFTIEVHWFHVWDSRQQDILWRLVDSSNNLRNFKWDLFCRKLTFLYLPHAFVFGLSRWVVVFQSVVVVAVTKGRRYLLLGLVQDQMGEGERRDHPRDESPPCSTYLTHPTGFSVMGRAELLVSSLSKGAKE